MEFIKLHPDLVVFHNSLGEWPRDVSTEMLGGLPNCLIDSFGGGRPWPPELNQSLHAQSQGLRQLPDSSLNFVRVLSFVSGMGMSEFASFASQCPNLEMIRFQVRSSERFNGAKEFERVHTVTTSSNDQQISWEAFPNLRVGRFVSYVQLFEIAESCPLLEELHVDVKNFAESLVKNVRQMANLKSLHLLDAHQNWRKCQDILADLERERPMLHVCVCSHAWPCGHPWLGMN